MMQATVSMVPCIMQVVWYCGEMLGKTYDSQNCSVARTLELVGERWSLLIVRDALFAGSTRFTEFQRSLGIATNILQKRLDSFIETGLMRVRKYSEQPELYEYVLTGKGRALAPALIALTEWGDQWAAPDGPPILYKHAVCGAPITQQTVCATCGTQHDRTEITAVPGPGSAIPETRMPAGRRRD
jgi:DNA-binding HxlR family transcriptional regulator